ncbi:MAG: ATP-dependent Clp protease proteolytic subunit [Lachnospiraceae bacterium]|nr:ATP-dependent Clp protease proteolytic subunit [Lachnospiraceae bacterium]
METRYINESSDGIQEISLEAKQLSERKVYLTGDVNDNMANEFTAKMIQLVENSDPIDIILNSPGGSVNAGLVIYDLLQELDGKIPVNIYCTGMAASMGAVLLAGGQKGRRFILPHSKCMIHEPLIQGGVGGSASSIKKTAESILETRSVTNGILAKHTGKTIEEIDEATSFDNYMNAEEAIIFGLCDEIRSIIG